MTDVRGPTPLSDYVSNHRDAKLVETREVNSKEPEMRISFFLVASRLEARSCAGCAVRTAIALLLFLQLSNSWARAQTQGMRADQPTMETLILRINALEARVAQLEAEKRTAVSNNSHTPPPPSEGPAPSTAVAQSSEQEEQAEQTEPERQDVSKTWLNIRGFGDVSLHGDSGKGDTTAFALGQLDLFVTSDISEKFNFLSEIVFEAGPDNIYGAQVGETNTMGVDVERYLLQYSYNDYLNISAGRFHTAIGYYNTAYHHSTWLQTTTDRPYLFQFEDRGGILPIHTVGISASGLIPSGSLGLHYVAEVGNGRASRAPLLQEPVQNRVDDQNRKAFNLAVYARPDAVHGLQVGFSAYHDVLAPDGVPRVAENIFDAYAVYILPKFEWLNEALVVRHSPQGFSHVFQTPGFYSQISRQFGAYRPYFRYDYVNAPVNEPIYPDVGLRHGPSVGLRYDASEFVALKLQYDRVMLRNQPTVNGLEMQVGFTF
jgi:hypothetical protein